MTEPIDIDISSHSLSDLKQLLAKVFSFFNVEPAFDSFYTKDEQEIFIQSRKDLDLKLNNISSGNIQYFNEDILQSSGDFFCQILTRGDSNFDLEISVILLYKSETEQAKFVKRLFKYFMMQSCK